MNQTTTTIAVLSILLALIVLSGVTMAWLSTTATGDLNRPQETLLTAADWMIKTCAGAIVGFAGGLRLANGKTNRKPPS